MGITLTIEARDEKGKRTHSVPGIMTTERATEVVADLFRLAEMRAGVAGLEAALKAKPKPERSGPAYVPLTGLQNHGKCGWWHEARTKTDLYCIKEPGHPKQPGIGAGHLFEDPVPAKVIATEVTK